MFHVSASVRGKCAEIVSANSLMHFPLQNNVLLLSAARSKSHNNFKASQILKVVQLKRAYETLKSLGNSIAFIMLSVMGNIFYSQFLFSEIHKILKASFMNSEKEK